MNMHKERMTSANTRQTCTSRTTEISKPQNHIPIYLEKSCKIYKKQTFCRKNGFFINAKLRTKGTQWQKYPKNTSYDCISHFGKTYSNNLPNWPKNLVYLKIKLSLGVRSPCCTWCGLQIRFCCHRTTFSLEKWQNKLLFENPAHCASGSFVHFWRVIFFCLVCL